MKIDSLNLAIVTHIYATGPAFKLEEYLKKRSNILIFIGHPFFYANDRKSFIRVYKKGRLLYEKKFIDWSGPELTFYFKDLFLTLIWLLPFKNINYFIGVDNLNTFAGYLLKLLGRVKKVIFYTIDYVPNRFDNALLNSIYHYFDKLAVEKSDTVWNLSPIMIDKREERGIDKIFRNKQIVVPIGTDHLHKILPFNKVDRYKIVHLGHLIEKQGIEMLIDAMKDVVNKIPKAHLLIIGGGPLEDKLREKVKKSGLARKIKFTGFIKKFSNVKFLLKNAAIAIAPYVDNEETYTRYTDPGKPKDYLASSIPVIITKVPQVAYEIEAKRSGIAINYDREELVKAIIELLTNKKKLLQFRRNAIKMAEKYRWDKVFNNAFKKTL